MKLALPLVLVLACLAYSTANAQQGKEAVATPYQSAASAAKGVELRPQVNGLFALIRSRRLHDAELSAVDLQHQFEALFDHRLQQFVFASDAEESEFRQINSQPFEWIDVGFKQCLQVQAFAASDRKDFPAALSLLAAIEHVAPMSSDAPIERGYILGRLERPKDALDAYNQALSIARRYPSQQQFRAPALRGIGSAFIDLRRLDDAEKAFKESLDLEPNNAVAVHELEYIRSSRPKN